MEDTVLNNYRRFLDAWQNKDKKKIFFIGVYLLLALALAIFHLYTSSAGILEAWEQRAVHLSFALLIAFLLPFSSGDYEKWGKWKVIKSIISVICILITIAFFIYARVDEVGIQYRAGNPNQIDKIMFFLLTAVLFIACKRYIGWPLTIIAGIFLAYTFFGQYLPGYLAHGGFSMKRIVDSMFISGRGIFGDALYASSVYIVVFILFGGFLTQTGVGEFFIKFADRLAGSFRGGPAKVAVVSSALMGTISGSGPGNVATTGAFTIPMMKKLGYEKEFAGAVEASASTGGIIMPPVMGATAFIMAEMTGIKYGRICAAALIPACLYFLSVFMMVHFEAIKMDLKPVPKEDLPEHKYILSRIYLFAPIIAIIALLLLGFSAMKAGLWGIIACVVASFFRKENRLNLERLISALEGSSKEIVTIAIACGVAGIIAGSVNLTGLGLKLSYVINSIAGGHLILALILIMILCIILGMGMPVTAAYIIVAATCNIIMTKLGMETLTASMFMFYFAVLSAVTPPVALSSYTAAGIAGGNLSKTGWVAVRLCLAAFIVPYMFVYSPELLMIGSVGNIIRAAVTSLIGVVCLAAALEGWNFKWQLHIVSRVVLFACAILLIDSRLITDLIAIGLIVAVFLFEKARARNGNVLVTKFGKTLNEWKAEQNKTQTAEQ